MNSKKEEVAKSLVSLVVAQVRNGSRKTSRGKLKSRNTQISECDKAKDDTNVVKHDHIIQPTNEEVTAQLQKFENMVIIQRLDRLVDMQKMQWEILNKLTSLLETMTAVATDANDDEMYENSSSTAALEELIGAQEEAVKRTDDGQEDTQYESAELFARRIAKVKNEIN